MNSPFHSILSGANTSFVIAEDDHFIAVLESKPLVLVVRSGYGIEGLNYEASLSSVF